MSGWRTIGDGQGMSKEDQRLGRTLCRLYRSMERWIGGMRRRMGMAMLVDTAMDSRHIQAGVGRFKKMWGGLEGSCAEESEMRRRSKMLDRGWLRMRNPMAVSNTYENNARQRLFVRLRPKGVPSIEQQSVAMRVELPCSKETSFETIRTSSS